MTDGRAEASGADSDPDTDVFTQNLIEQIFQLWVEPAIAERQLAISRSDVFKVLVVFAPSSQPVVFLNDESQLRASVKAAKPVVAGQAVTLQDIAEFMDLEPADIDPNAGWIALARIPGAIHVAFDFRRNRQTAQHLVGLAAEFVAVATDSLAAGFLGPAVENGFAAAELATKAEMYLGEDDPTTIHWKRLKWLKTWEELGNAPAGSGTILEELYRVRGAARYGDSALEMQRKDVQDALDAVLGMIEHARVMTADRQMKLPEPD